MFDEPETNIISGHVEGDIISLLQANLRVEIRSASNPSKIESVFPLPLSGFFQVKDMPKGKYLLQLQHGGAPSSTHRFESTVIEVDLEKHVRKHLGPLRYRFVEDYHKHVRQFRMCTCVDCETSSLHGSYYTGSFLYSTILYMQDLTAAPIYPLVLGISMIVLLVGMPR